MSKMGRPLKNSIDLNLLKMMIEKGFTQDEACAYFGVKYATIRYHARIHNMGRFKNNKKSKLEEEIIYWIEKRKKTMVETASILHTYEPHISSMYKKILKNRQMMRERFQWLHQWESAKDVEEN